MRIRRCFLQLLKRAGYRTHLVGKWDCGMATPEHTPRGRGYESSFGYFHHANDYWVEVIGSCPADPEDPEVRKCLSGPFPCEKQTFAKTGSGQIRAKTQFSYKRFAQNGDTFSVTDLWMADDHGGGEHGASNNGNSSCIFCNGSAPPGVAPGEYQPMHNSASLLGVNGSIEDYEEWKFLQVSFLKTISFGPLST